MGHSTEALQFPCFSVNRQNKTFLSQVIVSFVCVIFIVHFGYVYYSPIRFLCSLCVYKKRKKKGENKNNFRNDERRYPALHINIWTVCKLNTDIWTVARSAK